MGIYVNNFTDALRINLGYVKGVIPITILASRTDIGDTEITMWNVANGVQDRYIPKYTAAQLTIKSSSDEDTYGTGTGLRTVKISGLLQDYSSAQEVIEMDGTTGTTTENSYLAINEMNPETFGSTNTTQGNVDALHGTDILARIPASTGVAYNITRQGIFTVPVGATLYVNHFHASGGKADLVNVRLYANNPINDANILQHDLLLYQNEVSAPIQDDWIRFPEKHLLEVTASSTVSDNKSASIAVTGYLIIDNDLIHTVPWWI